MPSMAGFSRRMWSSSFATGSASLSAESTMKLQSISTTTTAGISHVTYTMAFTPRQYLSHIERNLGWPPRSQLHTVSNCMST